MMHLRADELVDIAEGTREEAAAPHLAACPRCRAQLAALRATIAAVVEVDLPEPSPLFWNRLSERVHDAVAAERDERRDWGRWVRGLAWRRAAFEPIAVVALVVLAVVVVFRGLMPASPPATAPAVPAAAPLAASDAADPSLDNDPSLTLVAALAANLDEPPDLDGGGAPLANIGRADHAVTHMNGAELRELHRILQDEMSP
jgi:hypothetical protein